MMQPFGSMYSATWPAAQLQACIMDYGKHVQQCCFVSSRAEVFRKNRTGCRWVFSGKRPVGGVRGVAQHILTCFFMLSHTKMFITKPAGREVQCLGQ